MLVSPPMVQDINAVGAQLLGSLLQSSSGDGGRAFDQVLLVRQLDTELPIGDPPWRWRTAARLRFIHQHVVAGRWHVVALL